MLPWLNLIVLILSTLLFLYFYVKSVSPAQLARKIGERAWRRCMWLRVIAGFFEFVIVANYVLYLYYPLPLGMPEQFPWPWWISIVIAIVIGIPSVWLMIRGMLDAGRETLEPKQEHTMYSGIYQRMRHPQALGEMPAFWVVAFALHSPFLVLWSFIYIPVFILMSKAEEVDLLMRFGQEYEEYRQQVGIFGLNRR
ncbi:methyltransferase family protein [Candidatus Neomarinimicrobiota bacterium]